MWSSFGVGCQVAWITRWPVSCTYIDILFCVMRHLLVSTSDILGISVGTFFPFPSGFPVLRLRFSPSFRSRPLGVFLVGLLSGFVAFFPSFWVSSVWSSPFLPPSGCALVRLPLRGFVCFFASGLFIIDSAMFYENYLLGNYSTRDILFSLTNCMFRYLFV